MRVRWGCPVTLGFALLVVVTLLVVARPYDQTYAVFAEPYGYVETGGRFGVAVGMNVEEARLHLGRRGWREMSSAIPFPRGRCLGRAPRSEDVVFRFTDESLRSGAICLFATDGKVRAMAWSFFPLRI